MIRCRSGDRMRCPYAVVALATLPPKTPDAEVQCRSIRARASRKGRTEAAATHDGVTCPHDVGDFRRTVRPVEALCSNSVVSERRCMRVELSSASGELSRLRELLSGRGGVTFGSGDADRSADKNVHVKKSWHGHFPNVLLRGTKDAAEILLREVP